MKKQDSIFQTNLVIVFLSFITVSIDVVVVVVFFLGRRSESSFNSGEPGRRRRAALLPHEDWRTKSTTHCKNLAVFGHERMRCGLESCEDEERRRRVVGGSWETEMYQ